MITDYFRKNWKVVGLQILGSGLSFVFIATVSRKLPSTEFGNWTESRAIIDMVSAILLVSIPQYIIYKSNNLDETRVLVFIWSVIVTLIITGLVFMGYIDAYYSFAIFGLIIFGVGRPLMLARNSLIFGLSTGISWLLCSGLLLASRQSTSNSVVCCYAIGFSIVGLLGVIPYCRRFSLGDRFVSNLKEFFSYNTVFYLANASQNVAFWYIIRQIKTGASVNEIAYFGLANTLVFSILLLPSNYLSPLIMKQLAEARVRPKRTKIMVAVVGVSILMVIAIANLPVIPQLIFGEKGRLAYPSILILCMFLPFFFWDRIQLVICQALGFKAPMLVATFLRLGTIFLCMHLFHFHITSHNASLTLGLSFGAGAIGAEMLLMLSRYNQPR